VEDMTRQLHGPTKQFVVGNITQLVKHCRGNLEVHVVAKSDDQQARKSASDGRTQWIKSNYTVSQKRPTFGK